VSRIGRWLRQPVNIKSSDVGWDWRDFGRSFGRFVGGYLDSGDEDTPTGRAWGRGGKEMSGEPSPRWAVILGLLIGLILLGGLLYLATMAGAL
jgi:hypothetical protein